MKAACCGMILVVASFFLGTAPAHAILVTVEADDFALGTDLSTAVAGVTLSAFSGPPIVGAGDPLLSSKVLSSLPNPFSPSLSITGDRVFGNESTALGINGLWYAGDHLSLPFSRSRYLGTGCGPWSWASDTTDTQRGPPWLRAESPRSGFQCTETHAPTGAVDVGGTARRQELTPLADCSDDGGGRPSASRRCGLRRVAPPVLAPGRPSPGRGGCGPRGSR
jgi:hypothetical protein